jgi:hypothetical protein
MPRFPQIWPVRTGHEVPAKIKVLRIVTCPADGKEKRGERKTKSGRLPTEAGEEEEGEGKKNLSVICI